MFDTTTPHRRHRLLVRQTHQPLFGTSFRKYVLDRGIQTLKKDLATRGARAGSGATTSSGRPGPTTRGPTRRCTARPRTWRSSRPQSSGSSKTTPTSSSTTRTSPTGASVRQRAAAGGRGLHDRPQHGGAGDPAEAGAAGAAGQRQRGGPADETGQAGGCEAAGRLPGASEAQDPRLASFENDFFEVSRHCAGPSEFPEPAQLLFSG